MPALNFQERFAKAVSDEVKRQTIRRVWKRPIKPGDTLCLYTGMRTKNCDGIGQHVCKIVKSIRVGENSIYVMGNETLNVYIARSWLDEFAEADGFRDWPEMHDWFRDRYGLPFEGVLIEW